MGQHEQKLVRNSLSNIAPNNSNKAARAATQGEGKNDTKGKGPGKIKPVVTKGSVITKKKSVFSKFKESFLGEGENLGDYLLYDVLIPSFRDTVSDMGIGVIERMFGNGRSRNTRSSIVRDRGRSYVTYNSNNNRSSDRRDIDRNARARHNFDDVVYTNKWEAEEVLANLVDMIGEYGEATVRSYYELSGISSDSVDEDFGWTNLRDAYVDRVRKGYIIVFPRTIKL